MGWAVLVLVAHGFMKRKIEVATSKYITSIHPNTMEEREMASRRIRHVGVAMDFSIGSKNALKWALNNLVKNGDELILIVVAKKRHAVQLWESSGSPLIPLKEFQDASISKKYGVTTDPETLSLLESEAMENEIVSSFKVYWGDAREKLCDAVNDTPLDCLVIGSRGLGTIKRALLGSVSNYVLNNASCPITVVKPSSSTHGSSPR